MGDIWSMEEYRTKAVVERLREIAGRVGEVGIDDALSEWVASQFSAAEDSARADERRRCLDAISCYPNVARNADWMAGYTEGATAARSAIHNLSEKRDD